MSSFGRRGARAPFRQLSPTLIGKCVQLISVEVAELVDAHDSGSCGYSLRVRVPSSTFCIYTICVCGTKNPNAKHFKGSSANEQRAESFCKSRRLEAKLADSFNASEQESPFFDILYLYNMRMWDVEPQCEAF